MKPDIIMRLAIGLVECCEPNNSGSSFAGDLMELSASGRSRWWCLAQAILRGLSLTEQRLRMSLLPFWYCIGFVLLHPVWQRVIAPIVSELLARYRDHAQWPGSAVLEIAIGLLPSVLFVWMGVFLYLFLRRSISRDANPVSTTLALNAGGSLLSILMVLRLRPAHYDLRLLSQPDTCYPFFHAHFSILLFLSLFSAIMTLRLEGQTTWRFPGSPLSIARVPRLLILLGPLGLACTLVASAQEATARLMSAGGKSLEFEVISIRPNHSGQVSMGIVSAPMSDGVRIINMPPDDIIQWGFGLFLGDQIVGVPQWAKQERYDITAKVGDEDVEAFRKVIDPIQRAPMLQKLLVDRFNLKFHYEMRELPIYALVIAKSGIRMTEIQPAIGPNGMKDGGGREVSRGHIRSMGQPMKPLVNSLTKELGRVVLDRTGLNGYYDFALKWTPDDGTSVPEGSSAPSIFTAVQEQLGLRLEPTKAPVQVLVVDRIERPSTN